MQDAVEPEDSQFFVELVFIALVGRNFDEAMTRTGGSGPVGMSCQGWKPRVWGAGTGVPCAGEVPIYRFSDPARSPVKMACDGVRSRLSCHQSPSGGMADAADSKSAEGNLVRVRLSPRALFTTAP
jgi:hypothetical protein